MFIVYTERRVGVSFSVYDMLHTDAKGYIIMCKLVKVAFCLCCGLIDPSNVSIRQLILQHSLNFKMYCINMFHNIAVNVVTHIYLLHSEIRSYISM